MYSFIAFIVFLSWGNYYLQYRGINFWVRMFFSAFGKKFIKSWFLSLFCKWFHVRVAEKITNFLPSLAVL